MKVLLLLAALILAGCSSGEAGPRITIGIADNGLQSDSSEVVVKNLRAGSRAEMVYRVVNGSSEPAKPVFYPIKDANVADYSKANGAKNAPSYVWDWMELPRTSEISPGKSKDFVLAIERPKDSPTEKNMALQIGVSSDNGQKVQPALGIWWMVSVD